MDELATGTRVLLVNLRAIDYPVLSLPLALPTLGGALKHLLGDGCAVSYFDRQVETWSEFVLRVTAFRPAIVGISAQFGSVGDLTECLQILDELDSTALRVVGNVVGTYAADELLSRHEGVLCCTSRGEESLVRLVEWLREKQADRSLATVPNLVYLDQSGRVRQTPSRSVPDSCVAPVDWDGYAADYDFRRYDEVWVEGSHGCPQKRNNVGCTYCAILPEAGSRDWTPRSIDLVMTDLGALARHGVAHVRFADEEFMANQPARAVEFANALCLLRASLEPAFELPTFDVAMRVDDVIRPNPAHDRPRQHLVNDAVVLLSANELRRLALRRLQDAGLTQVYLGVESGSAAQLRRMRKGVTPEGNRLALQVLRSLRLQAACGWIMFDPFLDSTNDLLENIAFIESNDLIPRALGDTFVTSPINTMRVLAGTPLKDQMAEAGLLRGLMANLLEYDFAYQNPVIGELVARLRDWKAGYDQARMYALKNRVAHAALSGSVAEGSNDHLYFDLKRLDFEVCKWLVDQLHNAKQGGIGSCIAAIPQWFHDRRATIVEQAPTLLAVGLGPPAPARLVPAAQPLAHHPLDAGGDGPVGQPVRHLPHVGRLRGEGQLRRRAGEQLFEPGTPLRQRHVQEHVPAGVGEQIEQHVVGGAVAGQPQQAASGGDTPL